VSRDGAYHQGTVWAWLIGPFVTAWVRVHGGSEEARREAAKFLEPFRSHLYDAGLGRVSEVFAGDAPHDPKGCYAQAWSTAEVLRAYVEDVLGEGKGD
jgi:glycogen debranching enzyme